jgi:uncharacterized protein
VGRSSEFLVDVTPLRKQPGSVLRVARAGPLDGLGISVAAVPEGAEVAVEAELAWASDDVVVTASIRAPWSGPCRRCLGEASGEVTARVREVYEPSSDGEETYPLDGSQVDLAPLVRDAVLLGLPPAPLCEEGCLGLCPVCGANRNEVRCSCDASSSDPRWAALDALRDN